MFKWRNKFNRKDKNCGHGCGGGQHGKGHGHCGGGQNVDGLSNIREDKRCIILNNPDKQLVELGMFEGSVVRMVKNDEHDENIVVASGESRFIVPRATANEIIVK